VFLWEGAGLPINASEGLTYPSWWPPIRTHPPPGRPTLPVANAMFTNAPFVNDAFGLHALIWDY
jgi:hypothetical protein